MRFAYLRAAYGRSVSAICYCIVSVALSVVSAVSYAEGVVNPTTSNTAPPIVKYTGYTSLLDTPEAACRDWVAHQFDTSSYTGLLYDHYEPYIPGNLNMFKCFILNPNSNPPNAVSWWSNTSAMRSCDGIGGWGVEEITCKKNVCPAKSTGAPEANPTICTCDTDYFPDSNKTSCVPIANCPVTTKIDKITDPIALQYEDGTYNSTDKPDLAHLNQATQTGLACIQQKVAASNCYMTPRPTSGYRPNAYQKHIREVYDKWQKLKDNSTPECADLKRSVKAEFDYHSPFARRPGETSNHSQLDAQGNPAGNAVDISGVPDSAIDSADVIACQCNMHRPLINMPAPKDNDPIHYQPRICPQ
jgi:hypothetical protein